ncbi:GNAT family N-acetyltransferase [Hoyosella altamirensis]|uniref:GNAT superfamily N-acetyltransferase n=1 Tax=Hoyosella altamirensis TaxID=616997 RepID=A0A839RLN6_9ACTN|nr:GNAT family N-acetyltransferase [Hoyosella altamirensis]MBB3037006.1 GNAT superfamily N-acetyltransferase [Hoyosella altamirensis]
MKLQRAVSADALQIAEMHIRSWQRGYAGLLPRGFLDRLDIGEFAAGYTFDSDGPLTVVAQDHDGAIRGFVTTAIRPPMGRVMALYVDPDHWREGIGGVLINAALDRFRAADIHQLELWVMIGNERAQAFYRSHGWQPDGTQQRETVRGAVVDELRFHLEIGREGM